MVRSEALSEQGAKAFMSALAFRGLYSSFPGLCRQRKKPLFLESIARLQRISCAALIIALAGLLLTVSSAQVAPLSTTRWNVGFKSSPNNPTADAALKGVATYNGKVVGAVLVASCEARKNSALVPVIGVQVFQGLNFPIAQLSEPKSTQTAAELIRMSFDDGTIMQHPLRVRPLNNGRNVMLEFDASQAELQMLRDGSSAVFFTIDSPQGGPPLRSKFTIVSDTDALLPVISACGPKVEESPSVSQISCPLLSGKDIVSATIFAGPPVKRMSFGEADSETGNLDRGTATWALPPWDGSPLPPEEHYYVISCGYAPSSIKRQDARATDTRAVKLPPGLKACVFRWPNGNFVCE